MSSLSSQIVPLKRKLTHSTDASHYGGGAGMKRNCIKDEGKEEDISMEIDTIAIVEGPLIDAFAISKNDSRKEFKNEVVHRLSTYGSFLSTGIISPIALDIDHSSSDNGLSLMEVNRENNAKIAFTSVEIDHSSSSSASNNDYISPDFLPFGFATQGFVSNTLPDNTFTGDSCAYLSPSCILLSSSDSNTDEGDDGIWDNEVEMEMDCFSTFTGMVDIMEFEIEEEVIR